MDYRSVEWHTDSTGRITEIAVEYNQTFLQWLFRKPATQRRWRVINEKTGETLGSPVADIKDLNEMFRAMEYIGRQRYLKDLEERCRKALHGE